MKNFKTWCSRVLILILFVSITVGCRGTSTGPVQNNKYSTSSKSIQKDESIVEISIALWDLATEKIELDPAMKYLETKLNIKIKPVENSGSDYRQIIQMWASSGQLPDIFCEDAICSSEYKSWITRGIIKAIPDDLSSYPHLSEYLSDPNVQEVKVDGKFYCIPRMTYDSTDYNLLDRVVCYRWDLAQRAGIKKEPETWDEFRTMLKAIVDNDPEKNNITGLTCYSDIEIGGFFWLYSCPAATSDGSGVDYKWIMEDGRYIPAVFSKNSLASLKFLRDFYVSGLIDKDLTNIKGNMAYDKFIRGEVAALLTCSGVNTIDTKIRSKWIKEYPEDTSFYEKVKLLKPLISLDGKRYHAVFKPYWSESYISSKVSNQKADRILKLFDYLNTPEFYELRRYGLEGVDYTKNGDVISRTPNTNVNTKYKALSFFSNLLTWDGMFTLNSNYSNISPEGYKVQKEFVESSIKISEKQKYFPNLTYLSTPTKDKFVVHDNEDMISVMLSSETVETAWDKILKEYQAAGLEQMIKEVNEAMGTAQK